MKPIKVKKPVKVVGAAERPQDMITGTENDFNAETLEVWEERVFRNASHFTVSRKSGIGRQHVLRFEDFPSAVVNAYGDARALVYAVCDSGRSFCVPPDQWAHYMHVWNSMLGSRS